MNNVLSCIVVVVLFGLGGYHLYKNIVQLKIELKRQETLEILKEENRHKERMKELEIMENMIKSSINFKSEMYNKSLFESK